MNIAPATSAASWDWSWRCLHCHAPLGRNLADYCCGSCGKRYPSLSSIPILVSDPLRYLRSEFASLEQSRDDARRRVAWLDRAGRDAGLSDASCERYRDVLEADIARTATLLSLLESPLQAEADQPRDVLDARRSGWTVDSLVPYLLRDWTDTPEIQQISARIGTALQAAFPNPAGVSVVFAACGAAGLLARVPAEFERVLGFDLTFPILGAARHLLAGKSLDLAMAHTINPAGHIMLRRQAEQPANAKLDLVAMDALNTAFADGSVDCVVTSFLLDLIYEPHRLAREIHRVLRHNGVWINYGPSGPLQAFLRFDEKETKAFLATAGFTVTAAEAFRSTYMDLSHAFPSWSFQNHICYLTAARKTGEPIDRPNVALPTAAEIRQVVPQHFPGATVVRRQHLGTARTASTVLRHDGLPGHSISVDITDEAARLITLVDGKLTIDEIANQFIQNSELKLAKDDIADAFSHYFEQGWLSWHIA